MELNGIFKCIDKGKPSSTKFLTEGKCYNFTNGSFEDDNGNIFNTGYKTLEDINFTYYFQFEPVL